MEYLLFAIIFIVAIIIFFNYRKKKYCPQCHTFNALFIKDSNESCTSIENLYPDRFQYKQYQNVYECKYCGFIKTEIINKSFSGGWDWD